MIASIRPLFALFAIAALVGCAPGPGAQAPAALVPLGEFKLGHNIVVADNVQKVQPSRDVTIDAWETALKEAVDRRFSGYEGSQFYHIAINVLGYSVAVPGVPVVLAPKSVMVIEANIWDDAAGGKINAEPKQFTVFESASPDFFVGSGLTKTSDEQVANLATNAAKQIEDWMRDNPEWFAKRD